MIQSTVSHLQSTDDQFGASGSLDVLAPKYKTIYLSTTPPMSSPRRWPSSTRRRPVMPISLYYVSGAIAGSVVRTAKCDDRRDIWSTPTSWNPSSWISHSDIKRRRFCTPQIVFVCRGRPTTRLWSSFTAGKCTRKSGSRVNWRVSYLEQLIGESYSHKSWTVRVTSNTVIWWSVTISASRAMASRLSLCGVFFDCVANNLTMELTSKAGTHHRSVCRQKET